MGKHVDMVSTGGFTGLRRSASMDLDDLPADVVPRVEAALAALRSSPRPDPSALPGGSAPTYRLTVIGDEERYDLLLREPDVPADLRPLIEALVERARGGGR
jgi:hypothetical protein